MNDTRCAWCDLPAVKVMVNSGLPDDLACRHHAETYGYDYDDVSDLLINLEILELT